MVFSVGGVVVNVAQRAQLLLFATAPQPPPLRVDVRSAERRPFRAGCSPSLRRHGWAPPVLNSASSPRPFAGCGEEEVPATGLHSEKMDHDRRPPPLLLRSRA